MSTHVASPTPERAGKRSVSLPQSLMKEVEVRAGKSGFSAVVSEALEQWLAMAKLREADERAFEPVSDEAMRRTESEW